jgi:REP element-mobilizing transposase RayT
MGRYKIYDDSHPYFITSSTMFGLPIFSNVNAVNIIIENLEFLKNERNVEIIAYVIMENHIHAILYGDDLADKIGRFKSFSARKIIDLFKQNGNTRWLKRLERVKPEAKIDRYYQLWQEDNHPKQIVGDAMMNQKIEYIHNNPVKRGYVDYPEDWRYSSARNYLGLEGLMPISEFLR